MGVSVGSTIGVTTMAVGTSLGTAAVTIPIAWVAVGGSDGVTGKWVGRLGPRHWALNTPISDTINTRERTRLFIMTVLLR